MKNILLRFFSLFLCFTLFHTSLPVYATDLSAKKTWDNIVRNPIGFFNDLFIEECDYLYSSLSGVGEDFKQVSKELYESIQHSATSLNEFYDSLPDPAKWGVETGLNSLGGVILTYLREEVVFKSDQYRQFIGDVICNAATTVSNNGFNLKDWLDSHISIDEVTKTVTFHKDLVDLLHASIDSSLRKMRPYVLVDTYSPSEVPFSYFSNQHAYNATLETISNLVDDDTGLYVVYNFFTGGLAGKLASVSYYEIDFSRYSLSARYPQYFLSYIDSFGSNNYREMGLIRNEDLSFTGMPSLISTVTHTSTFDVFFNGSNDVYVSAWTKDTVVRGSQNYYGQYRYKSFYDDFISREGRLYTKNGGHVKVWLDKTAFHEFSVDQRPFYVTTQYLNYDYSSDNSITVNGDYLVGNDFEALNKQVFNDMSQTIINNNYTNDISEERLAEILDAILQVKDVITEEGGSGGSGGSLVPSKEQQTFWDKVLDYLDKILKQLKQIKWFTLSDLGLSVLELSDNIGDIIDDATDDLALGLETISKKFPFSIPWDIAAIITLLAAEPEVPHFEIPIAVESIGYEHTIIIDLTDWVPLSKVSRFLLSVLFLLYLLSLSRKIAVFFNQSMS